MRSIQSSLKEFDPELYSLIKQQHTATNDSVTLIASENCTPRYVLDALCSNLSSKYSEGYPGRRFYEGNEIIDKIETLTIERALKAFKLNPEEWHANVQTLSGSLANFEVYTGLLSPGDRILHLSLSHGGHLSHGLIANERKVTSTSIYFETKEFYLDPETEEIDYNGVETAALEFRPKIIIAGASAYSRLYDYKRFREICDNVDAILLVDMAHIAGLIAGDAIPSPFPFADIVTTTTQKTLAGPRGAMIFMRTAYKQKINAAVFPGCQGGPQNHTIAGICAMLKAAASEEFSAAQKQIVKSTKLMCEEIKKHGFDILSNGTDNHCFIIKLRNKKYTAVQACFALATAGIYTNKNVIPSDSSPLCPSGIRLGLAAVTMRGMEEEQVLELTRLFINGLDVTEKIVESLNDPKGFNKACLADERLQYIKEQVRLLANRFPLPESDVWSL